MIEDIIYIFKIVVLVLAGLLFLLLIASTYLYEYLRKIEIKKEREKDE